jgi:hypothetical protein
MGPAGGEMMDEDILKSVLQYIIAYVPNGAEICAHIESPDGTKQFVGIGMNSELLYNLIRKELTGKEEEED